MFWNFKNQIELQSMNQASSPTAANCLLGSVLTRRLQVFLFYSIPAKVLLATLHSQGLISSKWASVVASESLVENHWSCLYYLLTFLLSTSYKSIEKPVYNQYTHLFIKFDILWINTYINIFPNYSNRICPFGF